LPERSTSANVLKMNIRSAYDSWHGNLEVDETADAPWHRLLQAHLHPEQDIHNKRVLEIGCGRGGLASQLAGHSPRLYVAADFSSIAIDKARAFAVDNKLPKINWEVGDIQDLAHRSETFDTVISCETIEHVPHPKRAISELARVLKPQGRLLLTTPNYVGTTGLYRAYLRLVGRRFSEAGQPINQFMMLPLTRYCIQKAGIKILATDAIGHYLPIPGRPPIVFPALDHLRILTKWFALHSLIVGVKP
jgi:2-polyprenyl-3-methyl-5-hydroxy-6-metoxy-1,4-benzoquinol methylase